MNLPELDLALRKLRLSGMADVLEIRLRQAQADHLPPLDLLAMLVNDELQCRQDRLLERRRKQARFRDPERSLDTFDFTFNKKMNRALIFELATARFVAQREDALFLGPPGSGKSHLAQAIGYAVIQQGYRVAYREAHTLLDELTDATFAGTRKDYIVALATVHGRGGSARTHHAALRTGLHDPDVESPRGGLGEAPQRHGRGDGPPGPHAPSRPCPQVRPAELADQTASRFATQLIRRYSHPVLDAPLVAGFQVSISGRF